MFSPDCKIASSRHNLTSGLQFRLKQWSNQENKKIKGKTREQTIEIFAEKERTEARITL